MDLICPPALLSAVTDIQSALDQGVASLSQLNLENPSAPISDILAQYELLKDVLSQLLEIFQSYNRCPMGGSSAVNASLDLSIFDWLSECALIVTTVRTEADSQLLQGANEDGFVEVSCPEEEQTRLQTLATRICEHTSLMSEFLPLLRYDLDEYLSPNIGRIEFGPVADADRDAVSRNRGSSLNQLRAALYNLNDEIKDSIASIDQCNLSDDLGRSIQSLQQDLSRSSMALTEALTNHGSNWIESMIDGKMTYNQFCELDQKEIVGHTSILRTFNRMVKEVTSLGTENSTMAVEEYLQIGLSQARDTGKTLLLMFGLPFDPS